MPGREVRKAGGDGCTGIVDLHLPDALESLGDDAFAGCDVDVHG